MNRYFLEVFYKGTQYAGFQVQENAVTIQSEVQKALETYLRQPVTLTGSSRTDTGVHARQNYFHLDTELTILPKAMYNFNALLPADIAIRALIPIKPTAHCRFDAIAREYEYTVYQSKDPFLADRAYFFPYTLELARLQEMAGIIKEYTDFTSFAKRNSQVRTFHCQIQESEWERRGDCYVYRVKANRFLRGMVRGLVATMLQAGRGKFDAAGFRAIIEAKDCTRADFSVPGHGLLLVHVAFPPGYFNQ